MAQICLRDPRSTLEVFTHSIQEKQFHRSNSCLECLKKPHLNSLSTFESFLIGYGLCATWKSLLFPKIDLCLIQFKKQKKQTLTVQENTFCSSNFGVFFPSCLRTGMLRVSESTKDQNEPNPRAFQVFIEHIYAQHWQDLYTQRRAG